MQQQADKDEELIIRAHKEYGNKWVEISKLFPGKTDNQIKNLFYCKLRKEIRRLNAEFKKDARYKSTFWVLENRAEYKSEFAVQNYKKSGKGFARINKHANTGAWRFAFATQKKEEAEQERQEMRC